MSITEVIERKAHKITKEDASRQKVDSWWSAPRWDYSPTGRLKFLLHSKESSDLHHTWADGKKQTIENCLGEIFISFEITAKSVKKFREDCAETARQRAEEQKRAAERQIQEHEYNRKLEVMSKFGQAWREAKQLREFAAALKESAKSPAVPMEQKLAILRIRDWIERHANFVDPLNDMRRIIRRFEKPDWQWSH